MKPSMKIPETTAVRPAADTKRRRSLPCATSVGVGPVRGGLKQPLRVLVVTSMYPSRKKPGYGAFVEHQVKGLEALGHDVEVLDIMGFENKLRYLTGAIKVFTKSLTSRFDVVHAHYGLAGVPALFRWRTPLIVTLHGSDALGRRWEVEVTKRVCARATAVIVVSKDISAKFGGVVIPCGVDLGLFQPHCRRTARSRLGLSPNKKLVLYPFDPRRRVKRFDLAEAVVNEVKRRGCHADLLVVHDADNAEMPWYYSAADAMLLCSDREGSPTAVKEALACDLPVVSTDVGDVGEITAGVVGTHVCQQNVKELADRLEYVLRKRDGYRVEGRRAMKRYDQRLLMERVLTVYQNAIRTFRGGA